MTSQQQLKDFLASYFPTTSLSTEIVCYSIFATVAIIVVVGIASVFFYKPPKPHESSKTVKVDSNKENHACTDNLFLKNLENQHREKKRQAREAATTPDTTTPVMVHHLQTQMYDSYKPSPSVSVSKPSGGSNSDDSSPSSSSSSDSSSSSSD